MNLNLTLPGFLASLLGSVVKNRGMQDTRRRRGFDSWVGKIPWRRKWQSTCVLAWEIPWTEKPGGLQFMGSQRIGHDWATESMLWVFI